MVVNLCILYVLLLLSANNVQYELTGVRERLYKTYRKCFNYVTFFVIINFSKKKKLSLQVSLDVTESVKLEILCISI